MKLHALIGSIWLGLVLMLVPSSLQAQIFDPVSWSWESQDLGDGTYNLVFKANIESGWHLYSQHIASGGPIPTSFQFEKMEGVEKVGETSEAGEIHKEHDKNFDMELAYFSNTATFTQKVRVTGAEGTIEGFLEFMVCDDERCLPPKGEDFSFSLKGAEPEPQPAPVPTPVPQEKAETKTEPEPAPVEPQEIMPVEVSPEITVDETPGLLEPVKWNYSFEKKDEQTYQLHFEAKIAENWKIYGRNIEPGGPIPTGFRYDEGAYELIGETAPEHAPKVIMDQLFDMEVPYFTKAIRFSQTIRLTGEVENIKGKLDFMTCDAGKCIPFFDTPFEFDLTGQGISTAAVSGTGEAGPNPFVIETINLDSPLADCVSEAAVVSTKNSGFGTIFLLGFLGGLLALLTPCVFPMIPLTVSFFTKSSQNRRQGFFNAAFYGFSILIIYVLLSVPFHLLESVDPAILNNISTNVVLNLLFFAIFAVFAFSFFGFYEITLPSGLTNKASSAGSSVGGLIGIFFMGLTLALVSFSCTGPILGTLLTGSLSSDGGAMQLTMGMTGFGLALALPFALFAAFPGWLNSLPRSGGWLNTVKVVLGFVELALALKFLSNADLVSHWGLLKREVFFAIWIVIGLGLTAYLFGWIRFPHDTPGIKPSKTRIGLGVFTLLFVAYLAPGLTNSEVANRKLVSGFPPPIFYSLYEQESDCPLGLECFKDYEEGLAYAREVNKPILLDFTGWACVNCRRMEENVWVNPEVYKRLSEDYVLISLYVDDRKKLPEAEQIEVMTRAYGMKKIRTIGNKWETLQTETFKINSQPYYALISPDEELLNTPVAYTPDAVMYRDFLDCGLQVHKKKLSVQP